MVGANDLKTAVFLLEPLNIAGADFLYGILDALVFSFGAEPPAELTPGMVMQVINVNSHRLGECDPGLDSPTHVDLWLFVEPSGSTLAVFPLVDDRQTGQCLVDLFTDMPFTIATGPVRSLASEPLTEMVWRPSVVSSESQVMYQFEVPVAFVQLPPSIRTSTLPSSSMSSAVPSTITKLDTVSSSVGLTMVTVGGSVGVVLVVVLKDH